MTNSCNSCSLNGKCSSDPSECSSPPEVKLTGSRNNIKNVIVVMSGKGGVGKSSVTALLAASLARQNLKVGVLDADITGPSQPKAFGIPTGTSIKASEYGIQPPISTKGVKIMSINFFLPNEDDPVIWRGPLLAGAVSQFWGDTDWQELDYMIVDLPPGTGDVPLTVMQSLPVNGIVMVSSPQDLSFLVVKKTIKMAQKVNVPIIGLIENMSYASCPHCGDIIEMFGKSQGEQVARDTGLEFLGKLPWDPQLNNCVDEGKIEDYQAPAEIDNIARKIIAKGKS
jgi:Mrp family chromosome partitioning ATPase